MKSSIYKVTILLLSLYGSTFANCGIFIQQKYLVPSGVECDIDKQEFWMENVLEEIKIEGTLNINDSTDIHIRFKKLIFGNYGVLQIGQKSSIKNSSIILEEINDSPCEDISDIESYGTLLVDSMVYEVNKIQAPAIQGSKTIRQYDFPRYLQASQKVIVVDPTIPIYEILTVANVIEKDITFKENLQYSYSGFPDGYSPIIGYDQLVISYKKQKGIFFKNMCLYGKNSRIIGVAFVDSKKIKFVNTITTFNIFYDEENHKKQIRSTRFIELSDTASANIFIDSKDLIIKLDEFTSFESNTFFQVLSSKIIMSRGLVRNNFINCQIEISNKSETLSFIQSQFFNSKLSFSQDEPIIQAILEDVILYRISNFKIPNTLNTLNIRSSFIEDTSLDLSSSVGFQQIFIGNSTFLCNGLVQDAIILNSKLDRLKVENKQDFIILENNFFIGYKHAVLTTKDYLDKYILDSTPLNSETIAHLIQLDGNVFISDKQSSLENNYEHIIFQNKPIINLANVIVSQILRNEDFIENNQEEFYLTEIANYNLKNQDLKVQKLNYIPYGYMINYQPFYLIIKEVVLAIQQEKYDMYITNNGQDDYKINKLESSYRIQVIEQKINLVSFRSIEDPTRIYDVKLIKFTISQIYEVSPKTNFKIFLQNFHQAIKQVKIQIQHNKSNKIENYTLEFGKKKSKNYLDMSRPKFQNIFILKWQNNRVLGSEVTIEFELCDEGKLLDILNNNCIDKCKSYQKQLNFFCTQDQTEGFGYYQKESQKANNNGEVQIYTKCGYGCKICESENNCTECFSSYQLNNGQCLDRCDQREYYNNNTCMKCLQGCQHCTSPNDCIIYDQYDKDKEGNQCQKNEVNIDGRCNQCYSSCSTCTNLGNLYCLSCAKGYVLYRNICVKEESLDPKLQGLRLCLSGFSYSTFSRRCEECPPNCLDCISKQTIYGTSSMRCKSCNSFSHPLGEASPLRCEKCPDGHYQEFQSCKKCSEVCDPKYGCFGPSNYQCNRCNQGYFLDPESSICQRCSSSSCLECFKSPENCVKCPHNSPILNNNRCQENCPKGYYSSMRDGIQICEECDTEVCEECENSKSNCTKCKNYSKILFEGQCYEECLQGYYYQEAFDECQQCDSECQTCISSKDKCTSCKSQQFLIDNKCHENCPLIGYYMNNEQQCKPCPPSCKICEQRYDDTEDYKSEVVQCVQCSHSYALLNGQCTSNCPKGYYATQSENQLLCEQCHHSCSSCSEKSQLCTDCSQGYYMLHNICVTNCPIGYFQDEFKRICISCIDNNCQECRRSIFYCNKCKTEYFQQQGQCVQSCHDGYYQQHQNNMLLCLKCDRMCKTCKNNSSNCTSCFEDSYSYNQSQCFAICPLNTYPDELRQCQQCHTKCTKGCVGPDIDNCLEKMQVVVEKSQNTLLFAILIPLVIIIILLILYIICYYRKKNKKKEVNISQEKYKRQSSSSSDMNTLVQLEKIQSINPT